MTGTVRIISDKLVGSGFDGKEFTGMEESIMTI